ncbi:MAG: hypothetical protein ACK50I_09565, partial [Burkholderiales bacterium]
MTPSPHCAASAARSAPAARPGRRPRAAFVAALLAAACATPLAALGQGTLRIGMTAADIPLTTGQADQGGEGQRFMANTVYDQLVMWDLS